MQTLILVSLLFDYSAKKIMVPNSTCISVVDTILRHDAPASLLFAMDLTYLSCWESEQLLQKDVNLLNLLAELEKQSQEEASRAVHQLIMYVRIRSCMVQRKYSFLFQLICLLAPFVFVLYVRRMSCARTASTCEHDPVPALVMCC